MSSDGCLTAPIAFLFNHLLTKDSPMENPDHQLPLPYPALEMIKLQLCHKCNKLFSRRDVTNIGICNRDGAGVSHPPHFFYLLHCRGCQQDTMVVVTSQGPMSATRFAEECEQGMNIESGIDAPPPPPRDFKVSDMPAGWADPENHGSDDETPSPPTRSSNNRKKQDGEPPEVPPKQSPKPARNNRPKVRPSIRACCPKTPITDEVLASAIRKLRFYSFWRFAKSFPKLMMRFGVDVNEEPEDKL